MEPEQITNSSDNNYEIQIGKLIGTAGTLQLSTEEKTALYKELEDADILIKKDGTIYAPWTIYVKRLNDAFTGTGWAMIPQGNPIEKKGYIYWGFHLILRGCYCGFAYGQIEYSGDKDFMTWGNAIEAAKSNALMRLCKELGIGLKMWDKAFIEDWMNRCAHQLPDRTWRLGPADAKSDSAKFDVTAFNAKLSKLMSLEDLKKEWGSLSEEVQALPGLFDLCKKHIARVKAIPKVIMPIYTVAIEDQQQAVKDFEKEIRAYPTAVEIEVNLEFHVKEYLKKGMLKENSSSLRAVALRIVKEKRLAFIAKEQKGVTA